jgi:molecular chaperone GrpE
MAHHHKHAPGVAPGAPSGAPGADPDVTPHNPVVPEPEPALADAEPEPESFEPGPEHIPEEVLEPDQQQLAAKAQQADQYLALAQRTKADFDNYRKRATRDMAAAQERGVAKLARELLPAVDNLDRALDAIQQDADDNGSSTLVSGIKLVHADVIAALQRAGIERFEPTGEKFDPQRHEAIAQQPVEGAEPGTVVEVYQRGYVLGDFVIRPARVVVAG